MVRDRWAVIRDAVSLVSFAQNTAQGPRFMDRRGAFEDASGHEHWGLYWDWLERDPDSGERNAPSNEKSGNLSGNFSDPAQNFCFLEK